jgi:hypothetical protein
MTKKKKIGIITFHKAHNYGAFLQCYALQEFLRSIGHEAFVIDYDRKDLWEGYHWFKMQDIVFCFQKINKIPNRIIKLLIRWYRSIPRFYKFAYIQKKELRLCPILEIENKPFDLILIGSDQVWNTDITHGFDMYYWGDFSRPTITKIATYAASLKNKWSSEVACKVKKYLEKLNAISVREQHTVDWIKELNPQLDPILVPDPVLLLDDSYWSNIACKPKKTSYVFFYQAMTSDNVYSVAKDIAKRYNKELIILSADVNGPNSICARNASPAEFLGWIKYADIVVTSSFHATAFSIIFNKDFYCVDLQMGEDNRSKNILKTFGLENRFIQTVEDLSRVNIQYPQHIQNIMNSIQEIAKAYIENI